MMPRTEYEMSEPDMVELLDACKSVPMIMLQCGTPPSPQENANNAWARLGTKMGFDGATVRPIQGKGQRFFTAEAADLPERDRSEWQDMNTGNGLLLKTAVDRRSTPAARRPRNMRLRKRAKRPAIA